MEKIAPRFTEISGQATSSAVNNSWIIPVIITALAVIACTILAIIGTSRRGRLWQTVRETIEGIGVFCLWLIRLVPKSALLRIPVWLGIPVVIGGLLSLLAAIAEIATPFFREVFGSGKNKTKK